MSGADIGLIGLAVMGRNLVLNLNDHGYRVAVYNRTAAKVDEFLAGEASGTKVVGTNSLEALVAALESPRVVMMMVKAGPAVDAIIDQLIPLLEPGDIVIDGGNSHYPDTNRRVTRLAEHGLHFVGMGISGGEEGARHGPSIMPGGDPAAWPIIKDMFQAIAARVDDVPCCNWVGEQGAGHYVKMVHNGIEYGDMQLIAEAYQLLRQGLGLPMDALAETFRTWNEGVLESYLIEITAEILTVEDRDGEPLIDKIVDSAGQKGTGKWTAIDALELGVPLTLIDEAVNSRFLSARLGERERASGMLGSEPRALDGLDVEPVIDAVRDALYASKIVSYAQGFMLMREAAESFGWHLDYGETALLWRGGCIIRSRFLDNIHAAYARKPSLESLLLDGFFADALAQCQQGWRRAVGIGVELGIPLPAFGSALAFFDGYRSARLPAYLLQAQRDYFGAHTYRRVDRDPDESFHFDWTGDREEHRMKD
jgi:6-phosphogluconate dehydrogenase